MALVLAVIGAGCAAPGESPKSEADAAILREAQIEAETGFAAIQRGDWAGARQLLAQALAKAERAKAPPAGQSMLHYQYGRALGVTCDWAESERHLVRARKIDEQLGVSPHLPIYELALMKQQQGRFAEAAMHFQRLIPLIEKQGLRETFPWGVADAYDRLAATLEASGRAADAAAARSEANAIRAAHPSAQPFGILTPYGSACPKPPG